MNAEVKPPLHEAAAALLAHVQTKLASNIDRDPAIQRLALSELLSRYQQGPGAYKEYIETQVAAAHRLSSNVSELPVYLSLMQTLEALAKTRPDQPLPCALTKHGMQALLEHHEQNGVIPSESPTVAFTVRYQNELRALKEKAPPGTDPFGINSCKIHTFKSSASKQPKTWGLH